MAHQQIYYRPEWTAGRYNVENKAAIFYNLIEGMSYFFEDDSAEIIGAILDVERNGCFSVDDLAAQTNTDSSCLKVFLDELQRLNLVTHSRPEPEDIARYRRSMAAWKRENPPTLDKSTAEKLPLEHSNVEMTYASRVGGITSVMLELTYNCSEKCIHCYNFGATHSDDEISHRNDLAELTLDDYKRIIDDLYEQGLYIVCLTGGDPFSKPYAWDIIDYLYSKGIVFDIFTNGQRIINDVDRLASYYPRVVGVSIYSCDAAVHDYITRIPGSWERSMKVVNRLAELAVPMNIKCCVMRPNVKTYRGVAEIARDAGAQPQFEINVSDSVDGDKCVSRYLRLTKEEYELVFRDDNVPQYVGKEAPNYGGQPKDKNCNGCGAGQSTLCLSPDGEVYPCCSFHMSFGNLRYADIKSVINGRPYLGWQKVSLADYEECGDHDYCDYCNLCPGHGYSEHGDFRKASENCCHVAKIRFSLAMKMMDGYDPCNGKSLDEAIASLPDYPKPQLHRVK